MCHDDDFPYRYEGFSFLVIVPFFRESVKRNIDDNIRLVNLGTQISELKAPSLSIPLSECILGWRNQHISSLNNPIYFKCLDQDAFISGGHFQVWRELRLDRSQNGSQNSRYSSLFIFCSYKKSISVIFLSIQMISSRLVTICKALAKPKTSRSKAAKKSSVTLSPLLLSSPL